MRAHVLRRAPRFVAFALPTAIAMTLAACGNVTGPQDQQPRRARVERVQQLLDTDERSDSASLHGPTIPWY